MDTSSIDLPDEIIELILSRCPTKSVGRFKSVSKSWQSIISNPRFSRIHHIQQSKLSENQNKFLVWLYPTCVKTVSCYPSHLTLEDGKIRTESVLGFPSKDFSPLCSCNGLILLGADDNDDEEEYMLWNPLIRKHIIIPAFTPKSHPEALRNRSHNDPWQHHLYFDTIADDYKILLGFRNWYTVYSCKNGTWGELKDIPGDLHATFPSACVDGCIYNQRNGEIVCFDARDGKLHKFPQPNDVEGLVYVSLEDKSGRLCLYGLNEDRRRLQLWVMENNGSFDKCWRKLISMEKEVPDLWYTTPLCIINEDLIVLCGSDTKYDWGKDKYIIYNPRDNTFQEIEIAWDAYCSGEYFYMHPYSENLCMPSSNSICKC